MEILTGSTEEFEIWVKSIAADLKKGIPEDKILNWYNTRWHLRLNYIQSCIDEAKKRIKQEAVGSRQEAESKQQEAVGGGQEAVEPPHMAALPNHIPETKTVSNNEQRKENNESGSKAPKSSLKISDKEFIKLMHEYGRIKYGKIAKAISEKYGVTYTRQAARDRGLNLSAWHPALQIDKMTELAENNLFESLENKDGDKIKVAMFVLDKLRKKRRSGLSNVHNKEEWEDLKREVFKIGDKIITFD